MQTTSTSTPSTGELVGRFTYGKAVLVFLLIFGIGMLGMACFVLYLSTILPNLSDPAALTLRRGGTINFASGALLIYCTSGFLALVGIGGLYSFFSQKKVRQDSFELYEQGIVRVTPSERIYTPYTGIEDLYLFGSGKSAVSGLVTNVAYRRNASEPFVRVTEALKNFYDFQQMFRELYLNARQPVVLDTLQAGGTVTFNYIDTAQLWKKRIIGNFLNIQTMPLLVNRDYLQVQGAQVPMSALKHVNLNAWTEKVVITTESGKVALSTVATGILSHDLFLNTIALLLHPEAPVAVEPAAQLV